jgi:ABC-2 type transport system permease protein
MSAQPRENRTTLVACTNALHDVYVMAWRNAKHIAREPLQLSDVTIQPVLFTLLFVYVFGSGIPIIGGTYADFVLAGLLLMNLTTSSMGTAVGLTTDLSSGVIDRFRTLPMWGPAVLIGRSVTDIITAAFCATIVAATGLLVGWRPDRDPLHVLAGFGVALLFAYAMAWVAGCVGLVAKSAESAQGFGFIVLFPLAFVSNALVPTQHMPGPVKLIADWNPVSAVTAACRELWNNPNPSAASGVWSMQHPVATSVLWSVALLAVCVPLASSLYRRRTTN